MDKLYTLITGASCGIGKEMAKECAGRGMNLLLIALPGDELEETVRDLKQHFNVDIHSLGIDLLKDDAPQSIYDWCGQNHYAVNILLNNIGLGGRSNFEKSDIKHLEHLIRLNIEVGTKLCRIFIPELKKHQPAYILNMSSTAAFFHIPYKAVYSGAKAYLYSFSRALRTELKPLNINVSVVCPGGGDNKSDPVVYSKVSGWMFRSFHNTPEYIAKAAIEGLLNNQKVIIPGFFAKGYRFVSRVMPSSWVDKVVAKLFIE